MPCGIDAAEFDERKKLEALFIPAYLFLERGEIKELIHIDVEQCAKKGYSAESGYIPEWEKYTSKGWQGPYLKLPGGSLDATYFDELMNFPEGSGGEHVYLPAMLTPWGEKCEALARKADGEGKRDLAMEYRKGKYYHIYYPEMTMTVPEYSVKIGQGFSFDKWMPISCQVSRSGAYIVCRGADCLPPQSPYVDVATYLKCEAEIRESALEKALSPTVTTLKKLRASVQQEYKNRCHECYDDGQSIPLEKRLSITGPGNRYYMDIGDDIVMSVFGSVIRSPMDR
jgi:hypothetical protein